MPTQTFLNLPQEKRERVLKAALEEFSYHSFSQASINRIVKAAGIARGSFYQYFADKEDVFMLVMEHIGGEKLEIFSDFRANTGKPFFLCVREALPAIFDWEKKHPEYGRIALLMLGDGSEFIRSIIDKMGGQQHLLRELLARDRANGFLRAEIDIELAAQLYIAFTVELLRTWCAEGDSREDCIRKAGAMLDIFGYGILSEEAAKKWSGSSS